VSAKERTSDDRVGPDLHDVVAYPSLPHPHSHPRHLATVAMLFGRRPPDLRRCRVLEIGCGSGGNLIPMAEELPEARFLGIDRAGTPISAGRKTIDALGLGNVELHAMDLRDVDEELGLFDYVICHGVYSWVTPAERETLLEVCRSRLADEGIAYVSFNTYPGFEFLAQTVPEEGNAWGPLLRSEVATLGHQHEAHWFHDLLAPENHPVYFRTFVEEARGKQLEYLAEAEVRSMGTVGLDADATRVVRGLARDAIDLEQYMDFLRNRTFRQSLLCHAGQPVRRNLDASAVEELYVAGCVDAVGSQPEAGGRARFVTPREHTFTTSDPILQAALGELRRHWPAALPFDSLLAAAQRGASAGSEARERLAADLLVAFAHGAIELAVTPPDCASAVGDRPTTGRLARWQAQSGSVVTNLKHESVRLDAIDRHVLRNLDGARDRPQLLEALAGTVRDGALAPPTGEPAGADEGLAILLADALERSLARLAAGALLRPVPETCAPDEAAPGG
jgi:methyltransferase-like protein/2-polyprenyl-3-methyl-5-hydroxy-6-metoxy-1,4-benzoquinol methylase